MTGENQKQLNKPVAVAVRREDPSAGLVGGDVDLQVATAKRYPRSIVQFEERALAMVTIDKETAASCSYAFKRGGRIIEGPNVRFYEIIGSCYGNMRVSSRTTGADDNFIYAESACWDLQSNFAVSCEIRRRITNREGEKFNDDLVGVTGNAAVSIAFRNSVARVVPRACVNEIWQASRKAAAGGQTLRQRRTEMLLWFEGQGVTEQQILDLLNISTLDDISKEQLGMLRGFAQSIKDGLTSIESIFNNEQQDDADIPEDENAGSAEDLPSPEIEDEGDKAQKAEEAPVDIAKAKAETINLVVSRISELAPGDDMNARAKQLKLLDSTFGQVQLKKIELLPLAILQAGLRTLENEAATATTAAAESNNEVPI